MALDGLVHDWLGKRRRPAAVAAARHRARHAADLVHDRHRHASRAPRTAPAARPATRCSRSRSAGRATSSACAPCGRRRAARLRIDGNEGWDLETARVADARADRARRRVRRAAVPGRRPRRASSPTASCPQRLPVLIDEGCRDLGSVAPIAMYADGIVIKLAKCGGIREALRMIHAARALDLKVMLGLHDRVRAGHRAGRAARLAGRLHRPRRPPADLQSRRSPASA